MMLSDSEKNQLYSKINELMRTPNTSLDYFHGVFDVLELLGLSEDFDEWSAEADFTAEWIHEWDDHFDWYICSHCGYGDEGEVTNPRIQRCPSCGSKMDI